jgi:hypothetical protein
LRFGLSQWQGLFTDQRFVASSGILRLDRTGVVGNGALTAASSQHADECQQHDSGCSRAPHHWQLDTIRLIQETPGQAEQN